MSTKTNLQARHVHDVLTVMQKHWDETAFPHARGGKCMLQVDVAGDNPETLQIRVVVVHVNHQRTMWLAEGAGSDFHDAVSNMLDRRIAEMAKQLVDDPS